LVVRPAPREELLPSVQEAAGADLGCDPACELWSKTEQTLDRARDLLTERLVIRVLEDQAGNLDACRFQNLGGLGELAAAHAVGRGNPVHRIAGGPAATPSEAVVILLDRSGQIQHDSGVAAQIVDQYAAKAFDV